MALFWGSADGVGTAVCVSPFRVAPGFQRG